MAAATIPLSASGAPPRAGGASKAPCSARPGAAPNGKIPGAPVSRGRRPTRVVVAEAHPLIRAGIRAMLATMDDVELVGEGTTSDDAIRLTHLVRPDVVLLGLDASDDCGLAATKTLSAAASRPRVVALTMRSAGETMVQALRAGASGLISKEADEHDVAAVVRTAASGGTYVRPHALSLLAASVQRRVPSREALAAQLDYDALSGRERAVLEDVAAGLSGPEIGRRLHITAKTVDTYRHRIRVKIDLSHRADYIRFALLTGVLKQ